jgi:hypothetical protein
MVTVADIQENLPNWPNGVIDPWLIEFANDPGMGWPPPDPYGDHRWGRLLGGRAVSWWNNVTWQLEKTECGFGKLTPKAQADVMDIRATMNSGAPDSVTKRRFDNAFRYILNAGTFPVPMVAMKRSTGLSLLDGSHRMAAFSALQEMPQALFAKFKVQKAALQQDVWIGTHSSGEVPLAQ